MKLKFIGYTAGYPDAKKNEPPYNEAEIFSSKKMAHKFRSSLPKVEYYEKKCFGGDNAVLYKVYIEEI